MDKCIWSCLPASTGCSSPQPEILLCTSIFQLPYGHADPTVYADGIYLLAKELPKVLPSAILRVFLDASLITNAPSVRPASPRWEEVLKMMAKMPHVQLVQVACPTFMNPDTHGHYDLFGTIFRFVGMFEHSDAIPLWLHGGAKLTLSFESDVTPEFIYFYLNIYKIVVNLNVDLFTITAPCTFVPWHIIRDNRVYHVLAGLIATKFKFPISWFNEFIEIAEDAIENLTNPDNLIVQQTERVRMFDGGRFYEVRKIAQQKSPFVYGFDEIFLNFFLMPKLIASDRPIRHLQLVINMFLRALSAKLDVIKSGTGFDVDNPHIQRFLTILSEVFLNKTPATAHITMNDAITIANRVFVYIFNNVSHSYTLATKYCVSHHVSDDRYVEIITSLKEAIVEFDAVIPQNPFETFMADCWSRVDTLKPFTSVVNVLGNGKIIPVAPTSDELLLSDRTVLCPPDVIAVQTNAERKYVDERRKKKMQSSKTTRRARFRTNKHRKN